MSSRAEVTQMIEPVSLVKNDLPEPVSPDPMNTGENVPIADDLVDGDVVIIDPNSLSGMGPASFFFHQAAEVGFYKYLKLELTGSYIARRIQRIPSSQTGSGTDCSISRR